MIEYKAVPVRGVTHHEGDEEGVVTALVSVTGVKDNVSDIIEPGAYATTLKARTPKGVWNHTWTEPVSKTLAIEELAPGAKGLPTQLPDGSSWPQGAGALQVKMQFNLKTQRGKDAYEDVLFFGDEQEWSIGYKVPEGKSATRDGIRHIYEVDLFEFSPVLFGAMPSARTKTVREAQMAYKSMMSMDFKEDEGRVDKPPRGDADAGDNNPDEDFDVDTLDDEELKDMGLDFLLKGDDPEKKAAAATQDDVDDDGDYVGPGEDDEDIDPEAVRTLIQMLENDLANDQDAATASKGSNEYIEVKAAGYATLGAAITDLIPEPSAKLVRFARHFDTAVKDADAEAAKDIGGDVLDILETMQDEAKSDMAGLPVNIASRVLMDRLENIGDMEDPQQKSAVFIQEFKQLYITMAGADSTREHGYLYDSKGDRVYDSEFFAMTLPDAALTDMAAFAFKADDYVLHMTAVNQLRARQEVKKAATITQDQRDEWAKSGVAMPDGSYPIPNKDYLNRALESIGRAANAGNLAEVKKHIASRAKALGLSSMLPDDWSKYGKGDDSKEDDSSTVETKEDDMPTMTDLLDVDNFLKTLR